MLRNDRRVKIKIKLWKKGKVVLDTFSSKKSQILAKTASASCDRGYIRVTYGNGLHNESEHTNIETLKKALSAYTERSLVDYATEG